METQFNNVTITIKAPTPEEAYTKLCEVLEKGMPGLEYTTDTYQLEGSKDEPTEQLWPKEEGE